MALLSNKLFPQIFIVILLVIVGALLIQAILVPDVSNAYGDAGEYLNNAWRVFNGMKPYRDFWLLFSPGEVYFPAAILKIFGLHYNIILFGLSVVPLLNAFLFCLVLRQLKCNNIVYLGICFIIYLFFGNNYFYFTLCLLSCLLLLLFAEKKRNILIFLSGICLGFALLLRIYQVAPFAIAAVIFLTMQLRKSINTKELARTLLYFITPSLIIILTCIFLLRDILPDMFYAVMVDSVSHGTTVKIPYWHGLEATWQKLYDYIKMMQGDPAQYPAKVIAPIINELVFNILLAAIPFLVVAITYLWLTRNREGKIDNQKILFIIWGILFLPYALTFSEQGHLISAFTPFLLYIFLIASEVVFSEASLVRRNIIKPVLYGIILLMFINSGVQLYQQLKLAFKGPLKIQTSSLYVRMQNNEEYNAFNGVINYINENTKPGEPIFALTWNAPPFYAITGRTNPTYYDSPADLLIRPDIKKEEAIIKTLLKTNTRLIIIERGVLDSDISNKETAVLFPTLINFVQLHYIPVKRFSSFDVYTLK